MEAVAREAVNTRPALLARIEELETALRPFAVIIEARDQSTLDWLNSQGPGPHDVRDYQPDTDIAMTDGVIIGPKVVTLGDLRRARAALQSK